jgi:hypothetical protein
LTPVFADLNRYEATTHFNGQSTIRLDGECATGESYTIAHHPFSDDGERKIMIGSLRYLDGFAKIDGTWLLPGAQSDPGLERDALFRSLAHRSRLDQRCYRTPGAVS